MALDPGFISTVPGAIATQGMGTASPYGGGMPGADFFSEMIRRRMDQQATAARQAEHERDLQMEGQQNLLNAQEAPVVTRGAAAPDAARYAGQRAALIQSQDASRPAPLVYRPATPGTTGGWQQDINAMDANQRQMFLPGGSQYQGASTRPSTAGEDLSNDELINSLQRKTSPYERAQPDWWGTGGRQ